MFTLVYFVQLLFQKVPFNLYSVLQCLLARQCSFLFCCWCSYKHTVIIVPGRFGGCSGSYRSVHQWCSSYSPAAHCWSHAHLQAQNVSHNASSVHLKNEMIRTLKSRCPATLFWILNISKFSLLLQKGWRFLPEIYPFYWGEWENRQYLKLWMPLFVDLKKFGNTLQ